MIDRKMEGITLEDDHDVQPVGPLEIARENLEIFADSLITQDSLRKMIDWYLVLEVVIEEPELSDLEKKQTEEEIEYFQQAWSSIADLFYAKGISA